MTTEEIETSKLRVPEVSSSLVLFRLVGLPPVLLCYANEIGMQFLENVPECILIFWTTPIESNGGA